jgi:hypothetical protein
MTGGHLIEIARVEDTQSLSPKLELSLLACLVAHVGPRSIQ